MQCPRCHADAPPEARFCVDCGARLALTCQHCGGAVPAGSPRCPDCDRTVLVRPDETTRFASPRAYTPKHLAERILTSRESLEGERKQVTVLFADLKGSMELLASRDPEEARRLLDPVLNYMMDAIHRYEGTVNQVMGDGIMALFGAPLAHEDHALRACYAALQMQDAARRHAAERGGAEETPLEIRVGINSGEVVVRSIGSDLRMDYSAVGETTHLAARMEQLATPGITLLTGRTRRLVEGYVEVRALGRVPVKGLAELVDTFELVGPGPARSRLQASAARGLTQFVGRENELGVLRRALERAREGHGQVVAIVGEAGVGKSRLVAELTRAHVPAQWRVIETGGVSYGRAVPYLPVAGLLRAYFQIEDGDDTDKIRDKVGSRLGALDPASGVAPAAILALLDVPVEEPAWRNLDPSQRRRRILDAVQRLLIGQSQEQPLCLIVEDLQWIDSETQAVLDRMVESLPAARILFVVTYRPEYGHAWGNRSYYTQLAIDPLPPGTAEKLLASLLGIGPGLAPLRRQLIEQTEGNPFFLEESVRHLAETGVLRGQPGAYRLAGPVRGVAVPATVQAVLAARIDRLPTEEKHLLQSAAVIGKHVPFPLLASVSDLSEDDLRRDLRHLQNAELLYEVSLFPHPEYIFKHALTLEVAAGSLLRERRRALDARIVEAIERLYPDRPGDQVDQLAHHAFRGEVWDKALVYCRQAGAKAFGRSAHRAAVEWFEQALGAIKHLPESPETIGQAIDLRLDLRYALSPLGEYDRMLALLREAEVLAGALGDHRRRGLVSAFLTNFFTLRGNFDLAIEHGRDALAAAEVAKDLSLGVLSRAMLTLAYCYGPADYRQAIELAEQNAALLEGTLSLERFGMALLPSVYSRTVLAWSLAERGEFSRALAAGEEGIHIAEKADHPHSLVFACLGLGTAHLRRGDFDLAVAVLERARTVCEAAELPAVSLEVALPLGSAYAQAGHADEAIGLLDAAIGRAVALRHPLGHWLRTGGLAEAYLAAGRADEALPLAQLFVEITRVVRARGSEAWAQRLLGEAAARVERPDAELAESALTAARTRARELGMGPLEARCGLDLARLYTRLGRLEDATREATTASESFRRFDMPGWVARSDS